ncbi:endothelial lipase-like, partial [Asbolus verrucosus]
MNLNDLLRLIEAIVQFRPLDVKSDDVTFYLFTRNSSWNKQVYKDDQENDIDGNKNTKIVIHGWIDNHNRSWYQNLTEEYLKKGDFNIIQIDWERVAQSLYISSAQNTKLVGHSLGAHVAAFAARAINRESGKKVARITGLDPAGPYFRNIFGKIKGLDAHDAEIVDVIHTDGGFYGYFRPLGTFDIYINGGTRIQPDCQIDLRGVPVGEFFDDTYCSHTRSYVHFIEVINNDKFTCHKCKNWMAYLTGFCNSNEKYVFGAEDVNKTMS